MRKRRGFTLMEIILVMAIMLIVSAMAAPLIFDAMNSESRIVAATDEVRAAWAECSSWAVDDDHPYLFSVLPNSRQYKIEPYAPNGELPPNVKERVIFKTLPEGIRFGTADHPVNPDGAEVEGGEFIPVAVFLPDGTAKEDVEITFAARTGGTMTLRLHGFSGAVTTVRSGQEGSK